MEHATNTLRSLLEGACTDLGSQCAERGRKMVRPTFKSCLAHVHRGLMWLRHTQMTGLTHMCKGLAES